MFVRFLATAALSGGAALTPTPTPTAPPTTLRYKVSVNAQSTADLSAFGAGEQKNSTAFTGFFTMTLTDTTGGRAITILLDSMKVDSATGALDVLQAAADSAAGASWHGLLTGTGKIEALTSVQGNPGGQQFETVLVGFFPRGNAHTRKKGETWADTLSYTSTTEGGGTTVGLITNFTAMGDGMFGSTKALQVNTVTATTSSGSEVGPNGEMQVDGRGAGAGTYYVTKDGTYLGGTNTVDSNMEITVSQAPAPIPVKAHTVISTAKL